MCNQKVVKIQAIYYYTTFLEKKQDFALKKLLAIENVKKHR